MSRIDRVRFVDGSRNVHPLGKVVCVGRNYLAHIRELNNPVPEQPVLFIKPASAVVDMHDPLRLPPGDVHFETELAVLIGRSLTRASEAEVEASIAGYGLALDLTRRDLQSELKQNGLPWEVAKAFDGSCVLSEFVTPEQVHDVDTLSFTLSLNDELRQRGDSRMMRHGIAELLSHMSQHFTLDPGDVVLTGTPEGVGPLCRGDRLHFTLDHRFQFSATAD
jgi:2-keto-4-pentenoate hydratase/2-oxohepta-3-ene-1,7-dioic acid hydratase in catechol pathway